MSIKNDHRGFLKFSLPIITILFVFAVFSVINVVEDKPVFGSSVRLIGSIIFLFLLIVLLHRFTWFEIPAHIKIRFDSLREFIDGRRTLAVTGSVLAGTVFFILFLQRHVFSPVLDDVFVRLFFLVFFSFVIGWFLCFGFRISAWDGFGLALLVIALGWQIAALLPYPLDYPFSLSWSETSWYYYASFFFDQKLYGMDIPWPYLDIGRPLLLSPVYLFPKPSLVLMRLWEFTLWVGTASLVAWALWKRLKIERGLSSVLFILWGILWVLLGPVYMHLSLVVVIVLLGFHRDHFFRSLFWIAVASTLGGIFRLNWIPVPAMLGLALYFLEHPMPEGHNGFKYLVRPFWIGLTGAAAGVASFLVYLDLSGRTDTRITSKFSAEFLWYRLLPNATLSTGIVLGALLVSAGLLMVIYLSHRNKRVHLLRSLLLAVMLMILFVGGSYASLKIGGGNNLHNLDAYLILLMVWGGYVMTGSMQLDQVNRTLLPRWLIALVFLFTAGWEMFTMPVIRQHDVERARQELTRLNSLVQEASVSGQEILFIQNRHLLTFGLIQNVPLVTDFELEELTEIAISNDTAGADVFKQALREDRYGLIVTGLESGLLQDINRAFAAENNAWKRTVYYPLQSNYESVLVLPESGIEVFAPKP